MMSRIGVRRFSTTIRRFAETATRMEGSNPYNIKVSNAQGIVNGLVGGEEYK
jgi:hypothetical protein